MTVTSDCRFDDLPGNPGGPPLDDSSWPDEITRLRQHVRQLEARNALLEQRAQFAHGFFDNHHAVMLLIDPATGDIVDANPAACAYYGYPCTELRQMRITDINLMEPDALHTELERARQQQRNRFNFVHRLANGAERHVEVVSGPVTVDDRALLFSIVHDVSERHQAGAALRESERRYRLLADNAADVIWLLDLNGRFTYVSPSVERLRGFTPDEVLQQTMAEALTPESLAVAADGLQLIQQAAATGEAISPKQRFELEQPCKDGSTVWTEAITSLILDADGRPAAILGVTRDISEQRAAQAAIQRQNEHLTLLNTITHAATSSLHIEDVLRTACQELSRAFALPHASALLLSADRQQYEFVADHAPPETPSLMGRTIPAAGNALVEHLTQHRAPLPVPDVTGEPLLAWTADLVALRGTGAALFLPLIVRGELIGCLTLADRTPRPFDAAEVDLAASIAATLSQTLHNATLYRELEDYSTQLEERVRQLRTAEQALHQGEERYRMLADSTFEGIVLHERGIILDANSVLARLFGYDVADLTGLSVLELVATESVEIVTHNMLSDANASYEITALRADGDTFPAEILSRPVPGGPAALRVAAVRDITVRKQAEARAMELALERERVTMLQRMIGDVGHDFKTPLASIKLSVSVLRQAAAADKRTRHMDIIDTQVARLHTLLDDLLSMSQLDQAASLSATPHQINTVVARLLHELEPLADERRTHLVFAGESALPPVCLDADQFSRAVSNVIVNSINYSPPGTTVSVHTFQRNGYVGVEVIDQGIGISAGDLPHIFDRFYRADPARSSRSGGLGIGLSIVKKIMDAHRGWVEVESEPGQGSTFRLLLPLNASPPAASAPPDVPLAPEDSPGGHMTDGH